MDCFVPPFEGGGCAQPSSDLEQVLGWRPLAPACNRMTQSHILVERTTGSVGSSSLEQGSPIDRIFNGGIRGRQRGSDKVKQVAYLCRRVPARGSQRQGRAAGGRAVGLRMKWIVCSNCAREWERGNCVCACVCVYVCVCACVLCACVCRVRVCVREPVDCVCAEATSVGVRCAVPLLWWCGTYSSRESGQLSAIFSAKLPSPGHSSLLTRRRLTRLPSKGDCQHSRCSLTHMAGLLALLDFPPHQLFEKKT